MPDDFLLADRNRLSVLNDVTIDELQMQVDMKIEGPNYDLAEIYFWHINFGHTNGKGYNFLKFEDQHYFSETSQFGGNFRQIKGNTIRAFQENFQQLITLIRQHLIPLLKEVKEAHFYKRWFDKITINDALIQDELNSGNPSSENLKKYRAERNEAVNHLKDKWVNEVDGGKIWQMHKPQTEQGLDFAMLPQLFFGINLDDPFQTKRTLKEQLDEDVYPVDVSLLAKENVARFMYRFYTWLPTAIKDTEVTFKLKISALRNIYSQTQMYINFMKPLLSEISRKMEGISKEDVYRGFDENHPDLVNILDTSFSYIKIVSPMNFFVKSFGKNEMKDIEFTPFGLFINGFEVIAGKHNGKSGFLGAQVGKTHKKYVFYPSEKRDITGKEFKKIKEDWQKTPKYIFKKDLRKLPIIEYNFSQRRIMEQIETPQGPGQVPFNRNKIEYKAGSWNIYELAAYREKMKEDNLTIMETFIDEIGVIKEDLLMYVNYFNSETGDIEDWDPYEIIKPDVSSKKKQQEKHHHHHHGHHHHHHDSDTRTLALGPFQAIGDIVSFFIPSGSHSHSSSETEESPENNPKRDKQHLVATLKSMDDLRKVYDVFKKTHGYPHY